jgi:hypothetical protein
MAIGLNRHLDPIFGIQTITVQGYDSIDVLHLSSSPECAAMIEKLNLPL